jgi:uncharacterized protein YutE (UPF0331/DUF86 family)
MSPSQISSRVVADRMRLIEELLGALRRLPLADREAFFADERNVWAAESYLRRMLEAMLDIGRHILAKGFGVVAETYRDVPTNLLAAHVLSKSVAKVFGRMAGYRNRMVHFYHEMSKDELYEICVNNLGDVELVVDELRLWVRLHADQLDLPLDWNEDETI